VCGTLGYALLHFVNEVRSGNAQAPMVETWKAFYDATAYKSAHQVYIPLLLAS
jgi:hypothetical protein